MINLKVIHYQQCKKKIILDESIKHEIDLINQFKNHFSELRIRVSLEELIIINEVVYEMLEENNQSNSFFEYMDRIISNALYYSLDTDRFDRKKLIDSFQIYTTSDILNSRQLKDIHKQFEKQMSKKKKALIQMEVRCKNGKTKF